jgi:pyruvate,orthophosphate dikinase
MGYSVSVMAMVFGNMGNTSATGVCFSRDAATGENRFNGEYLVNAQGEDVVAGIRTPQQITKEGSRRWAKQQSVDEITRATKYPSMEEAMPEIYKQLNDIQDKLEKHYHDMQDMEFTVQEGKLWFLQTRNGKRTGAAMVKIAMDLAAEGLIDEKTALERCEPNKLDELLHPVFDKEALKQAQVYLHVVFLLHQVLLVVRLYSLLMMQRNGIRMVIRLLWYVLRLSPEDLSRNVCSRRYSYCPWRYDISCCCCCSWYG